MRDLEEIRLACRIEDGHWLWSGAVRKHDVTPRPAVWAPDYTRGGMRNQPGARAVWHCATGRPIPKGWNAFCTCSESMCLNPAHIKCMSKADWGKYMAQTGAMRGQMPRILANRATGRARAKLTPEIIQEVQASDETGIVLASRYGVAPGTISRARRGEMYSMQTTSPFAGLGAR